MNIKKVGHIGTLDPLASGVLIILIGEATKLSDYLMEHDKEYIAKLHLGEKRDTGDGEGKVIQTKEVKELSKEQIEIVLKSFLGESNQIPPMYSALKVNGKKLYDLARQGKTIERKPRKIEITEIELKEFKENEITFRVVCSKGTYIRVLCEDIAEKLGTCGYMKELKRTRIGSFKIEDKGKFIELEDILRVVTQSKEQGIANKQNNDEIQKTIDNRIDKTEGEDKINLKDNEMKKVLNGVKIKVNKKDGLINLYNNGQFIGIGEIEKGNLKRKIII